MAFLYEDLWSLQKVISGNLVSTNKIIFGTVHIVETWVCAQLTLTRSALQVF